MKVLALISGGKDSVFNMVKCVEKGHEIVALANALPPSNSEKEELDSFLFQTVGQSSVHYIAQCMDLPLYQVEINGLPVNQSLDYEKTINDETEDLYVLVKKALDKHPDIGGVSVGAILSSYQSNRVKNILGLQMLAYLWQRDQGELLSEMIDNNMNSILIKVAGIGLGKDDLCKSLSEMKEKLEMLASGEYETFTLDCPLFKKKIEIVEWEPITHSDSAFASVYYVNFKKIVLKEKNI
ncbi:hypothetical protein BB559_001625 [Furculomyces boomerangus]|uniref:Diphthine--ammonia ligase n=1 Tax=Furculomyces boomerangus TaxID=61424 RepID=A0A2T9Z1D1_9FUNG|nr:hypothetical protein BB559_001625 [Furculomyces boomerangus]